MLSKDMNVVTDSQRSEYFERVRVPVSEEWHVDEHAGMLTYKSVTIVWISQTLETRLKEAWVKNLPRGHSWRV